MRERTGIAVHASPTAPARPPFGRSLLLAAIAALFLAFVGALGTDAAPLLPRTGYWLVVMLTGGALGGGIAFAVQSWGALRNRRLLEGALISALIAVPLSAVVLGANMVVFHVGLPTPDRVGWTFAIVLVVSAVMTALGYATSTMPLPDAEALPPAVEQPALPSLAQPLPDPEAPPPLVERLPPRLRAARLLALEAEDHYLRVHTDAGSDLILMRLSDAIAEIGAMPGARCHRSWWVARTAVTAASRRGAGAILQLEGGLEVPVSRTHLPALKADGWF